MSTVIYHGVEFDHCGTPATEQQIAHVEEIFQAKLPPEYRTFLARMNGATARSDVGIGLIDEPDLIHRLGYFFSIDETSDEFIVNYLYYFNFAARVPDAIIPVAITGTDRFVCISLRPKDRGTVYLWIPFDRFGTDEGPPWVKTEEDFEFVAKDLDELWGVLKPILD